MIEFVIGLAVNAVYELPSVTCSEKKPMNGNPSTSYNMHALSVPCLQQFPQLFANARIVLKETTIAQLYLLMHGNGEQESLSLHDSIVCMYIRKFYIMDF